jgi:ADP-ribose pyrophosphatase YjhB (NUDIX family)
VGVGVVVWRGDKVLLVRRGKSPNHGQWSLPGGAQELGEPVSVTAQREVREETALDICILGLVDVVDSIHRDPDGRVRYHYTLIDIAAEARTGKAVAGEDAAAVGWFTLDELHGLGLWQETERVIRKSLALRQPEG